MDPAAQQAEEASAPSNGTRVMLCVDDSHNAHTAFDYYLEHLHLPNAEILIAHVVEVILPAPQVQSLGGEPLGQPAGIGSSPAVAAEFASKEQKKSDAIKLKFTKKCQEKSARHQFLAVFEGGKGIGPAICEKAKKENVDLIVMGSRGLGAVRRTFLGSVSDYVLHHSHIPTLICPKKK